MNTKQNATLDDLLDATSMTFAVCIVAIAKQMHENTGANRGEFKCPRCHTGTVKWSIAHSNGHDRVVCSTKWTDEYGVEWSCTEAMEQRRGEHE